MEEKEQKILDGAGEVFMKFGVKSVNMDDVARRLGMSKKTLYKFVKDKEDLLRKAMMRQCITEEDTIRGIADQGLNAIEESLAIMRFVREMINGMHPSVVFDMEKYYPEILHETMHTRQNCAYDVMRQNVEKGMLEGYYRKDLNANVISTIYMASIDFIISHPNDQGLKETPLLEQYKEMFRYHILGIASEKGRKYLKEVGKQEF